MNNIMKRFFYFCLIALVLSSFSIPLGGCANNSYSANDLWKPNQPKRVNWSKPTGRDRGKR
ncbi:MAG TPA: hypothetical protein DCM08_12580 [Microscillaceae bacterium]|nr:hypothetical protein [Microscillaceae bacterium]